MLDFPDGPLLKIAEQTPPAVTLNGTATEVEWFGMDVTCEGPLKFCPSGGGMSSLRVGQGQTFTGIDSYTFESVAAPVSLSGALQPTFVLVGGSVLDASVIGSIKLPLATAVDCSQCAPVSRQTLFAEGQFTFSDIVTQDDGFSANLDGDIYAARINEEWVSPEQLGFFGTAAAATAGIALIIKFLLAPLFTRLSKSQALEHPRRKAIYEYVAQYPGANFREVARGTGIATGTVRHHLTILERSGHLVERAHNGTVRLFENHGKFDHNWSDLVLLREPPLQAVHDWLKAHPQSPQKDILEALEQVGWSRSTTQHRLVRLVEGGLVSIRLQGRLKIYSVVERIAPKPTLASILGIHTPAMAS